MASRHSDFGYWKCENGDWIKKYKPSYEKPKLSCPEMEKTKNDVRKANRCPKLSRGQNCSELCQVAGGVFRKNHCVGKLKYHLQPCSDQGECENHCILERSPNMTYYNYPTPRDGYFLGPGYCWGYLGYVRGMYCSASSGYFGWCGAYD